MDRQAVVETLAASVWKQAGFRFTVAHASSVCGLDVESPVRAVEERVGVSFLRLAPDGTVTPTES